MIFTGPQVPKPVKIIYRFTDFPGLIVKIFDTLLTTTHDVLERADSEAEHLG
jgi:hypothetical protein